MLRFRRNGEDVEVKKAGKVYSIKYPCEKSFNCSSIESTFPPGYYKIELYGASGGHMNGYISTYIDPATETCNEENVTKYRGNTKCVNVTSMAGAGGYTSAYLSLHSSTKIYLAIGGKGIYSGGQTLYGGFNGGGRASPDNYGSSGGGATDLRFHEDDYWHRVLVAGGGGGTDNQNSKPPHDDNGRGGAGGGLIAQGPWKDNVYQSKYVATQEKGFTFGNGESAQKNGSRSPDGIKTKGSGDMAGAGGGWFGGFSTHNNNGGAGGGSSFALTYDATVPTGDINSTDSNYESLISKPYAIIRNTSFSITNPIFAAGIWDGDGFARITAFDLNKKCTNQIRFNSNRVISLMLLLTYS